MKLIFDYKFRFYTSKMNEICLYCHLLYFSSIILSFGHCVLRWYFWNSWFLFIRRGNWKCKCKCKNSEEAGKQWGVSSTPFLVFFSSSFTFQFSILTSSSICNSTDSLNDWMLPVITLLHLKSDRSKGMPLFLSSTTYPDILKWLKWFEYKFFDSILKC